MYRRTLVASNMTAFIKTLNQACPVKKGFLTLSTNIPFLDSNTDAFSTRFQEDFKPFPSKKAQPVSLPISAQVDHKDLRYIKEYRTEATESFKHHPLPQITRIPHWPTLNTNFKMQRDPEEVSFLTTQSQNFPLHPFQHPPTPIRQTTATKRIQQAEKLPESTSQASFISHNAPPIVKAKAKHLEEGFPTIKVDGCHQSFVSEYNNTFQGACSKPAQSMKKPASVTLGDPVKIVERETTQATSFTRPTARSPPVVKERLKLNLGNFSEDPWSSTSREAFCFKLGAPVVLTKRNQNFSSLPKGDTDARHNKERMSFTTSRISFTNSNHTKRPVYVCRSDLKTKSNVQFSSPRQSDLYYTTSSKEHYSKQDGERARPAIQLPSNILSGPEHGPTLSTTKTDYIHPKPCIKTPCLPQQQSKIRFPLSHQKFSTTHSEHYTPKPLSVRRPGCSQFFSHFVID